MNIKIKQLIESTFTDVIDSDTNIDSTVKVINDFTHHKYFPENKW